ncbi:hypothetical protein PR048_001153 [Dryococelus australis]|uniref:Uncharacterized protein n=1 Tax=Dryococelus australis TaxID=614101 RepID=A0ABQ9IGK3_9NEOP|nr:hypothetical protein PR048_001153 [Dryococelus australis]
MCLQIKRQYVNLLGKPLVRTMSYILTTRFSTVFIVQLYTTARPSHTEVYEVPSFYSEPLKISRITCDHLQDLKQCLPADFHSFYDQLPHEV